MFQREYLDLEAIKRSRNRNESEDHYLLKHVGRAWLWEHGFNVAGLEVPGLFGWCDLEDGKGKKLRFIADCAGVGYRWSKKRRMLTCKAIEVKVSRNDYRSGFCMGADFTYILCPTKMLSAAELPKGIGLIEADMDKLSICVKPLIEVTGLRVVKKASFRCHVPLGRQTDHHAKMVDIVRNIAMSNTRESITNHGRR